MHKTSKYFNFEILRYKWCMESACRCGSHVRSHQILGSRHDSYQWVVPRFQQNKYIDALGRWNIILQQAFPRPSLFPESSYRSSSFTGRSYQLTAFFTCRCPTNSQPIVYSLTQSQISGVASDILRSTVLRRAVVRIRYFRYLCPQRTVCVSFCLQVTPARRSFYLYFLRASGRAPGALRVLGYRPTSKVPRVGRARRCDRRVDPLTTSLP